MTVAEVVDIFDTVCVKSKTSTNACNAQRDYAFVWLNKIPHGLHGAIENREDKRDRVMDMLSKMKTLSTFLRQKCICVASEIVEHREKLSPLAC